MLAGFSDTSACDVLISHIHAPYSDIYIPTYAGTYSYVPEGLPTNFAINITNVTIWGVVGDAFKIQGQSGAYQSFAWVPGQSSFSNDVTDLVSHTLGGANTNGIDFEMYWYRNDAWNQHERVELSAGCRIQFEKAVPVDMAPDYDRNGVIDTNDSNYARTGKPFRFWVNDDDDSGYDGGTDISGDGSADGINGSVDGVRDLIDFFPVHLDLTNLLAEASYTNGYEYYLCHDDSALRVVEAGLTPAAVGDYLRDVGIASGLGNDSSSLISSSGWQLDDEFLEALIEDGESVVLIEAIEETDKPLRLELRKGSEIIGSRELPLSITGVEDMFRHKNLRADIYEGATEAVFDRNTTPNWSSTSGKNIFFLHGANVEEQSARGWHSEFFKRLWWEGLDASFHGITWYGDKGSDANYQENANNAFKTASYLKDYVASVGGTKVVLAHSLGNIVVSSAIEDHGMSVSKYLMLDAAVASEAYDASIFNAATNNNPMLHASWREYESQTWSANFHELYSYPDKRAELTWQSRFENVVQYAYNFYSSEDEVFEIHPDSVSVSTGLDFDYLFIPDDFEHYTWQKQEVFKGRDSWVPGSVGTTKWWGWGFRRNWLGQTVSAVDANLMTEDQLRGDPVFRHGRPAEFYVHVNNLSAEVVNEMLAMGIPAMSHSAGQTSLPSFTGPPSRNINISTFKENGWPRNHETYVARWLHNDCRNMAYLYTYKLFEELVLKGGLE